MGIIFLLAVDYFPEGWLKVKQQFWPLWCAMYWKYEQKDYPAALASLLNQPFLKFRVNLGLGF